MMADHTPRFDWQTIIKPKDGETIPDATVAALSRYFGQFCEDRKTCPGCGENIFDEMSMGLLATFRWGLVHGHGSCECGWPAVVHHSVPDDTEGELMRVSNFPLIVHPDYVSAKGEDSAIEADAQRERMG